MSAKDPHNSFTALEIEKVISSTINLLLFGSGAILLFMSQRRKYLDKQSLVCIGIYLVTVIINCVYSIFDIVYEDQWNLSGKQIPTRQLTSLLWEYFSTLSWTSILWSWCLNVWPKACLLRNLENTSKSSFMVFSQP